MFWFTLPAVAGLVAGPAFADGEVKAGACTVKGTNFSGSPYSGKATITIDSDTTCEIVWQTGSTTSNGICMRDSDSFAAAYRMGDAVGLVIYKIKDDGSLEGVWTIAGKSGAGTETLTPE
jgi:hypothetical protein